MVDSTLAILSLALGFGMLHALDADHVLTVSGISAQQNRWSHILKFSAHWALGHGASLLCMGVAVFLLGFSFQVTLSKYAELSIAVILTVLGIRLLCDAKQDILRFDAHSKVSAIQSNVKALTVGSIHGIAGTASIFVLIPIAKMDNPLLAVSYLAMFSVGVLFSMLVFGGFFRHTVVKIIHAYPHSTKLVQVIIGLLAMILALKIAVTALN